MDISSRIANIKARIAKLKSKDSALENFGAGDNPWYDNWLNEYLVPDSMPSQF